MLDVLAIQDLCDAGEIAIRGPQIGLHCHRHRLVVRLTPHQVLDDLRRAAASIEEATGRSPSLYRPPYGAFSVMALLSARQFGWLPALWSRDAKDWRADATPTSILRRATKDLRARGRSIPSLLSPGSRSRASRRVVRNGRAP
jgi:peptidoglycan/xylan/chitin deacetylase (PgdA/CDA1 family)